MKKHLFPCGILLGLMLAAAPLRAADADPPTIQIRVQSIDGILGKIQYLAELAGKGEEAKQFQGMIMAQAGGQGLKGIDTKRPIGAYATIGPNGVDSVVVVLVPVADEKAFVGLLENLNAKATKGADDVYSIQVPNVQVPVFFRFANKYAYATVMDKGNIAKEKLPAPEKVLPPDDAGIASFVLRIDQIPENLKQMALTYMEMAFANLKDQKNPSETEAQHKVKAEAMERNFENVKAFVTDGKELAFKLNVDTKANDLSFEFSVSAKPGTKLAATIAQTGGSKSLFGSWYGGDAAALALLHQTVSKEDREFLVQTIENLAKDALGKEQDAGKKKLAEEALKALMPTVRAGDFDFGGVLRGPGKNGHYTFLGGIKLAETAGVEKLVRDVYAIIPPNERKDIALDAETAGDLKVHRITVSKADEQFKQIFGDSPVYFTFSKDALLVSLGDDALGALKGAASLQPKNAPAAYVEVLVSKFVPLIAFKHKNAEKAAHEAFSQPGSDKVRLIVEGGSGVKFRIEAKAQIVKFIGLLDKGSGE